MDEKALLSAQVRALLQQLDWAENSLRSTKIDASVSSAASIGFAILFQQRRDDLEKMQTALSLGKASGSFWKELRDHSVACGELFKECLGFLGGALLRSEHGDSDICKIADGLLGELSDKTPIKWERVTLLADANFFTETTGLIRLPFPDYGIWNLPIAVHELGHFVGPRIPNGTGGFPFLELIQQKTQNNLVQDAGKRLEQDELETQLSHLRELFSDLFAVFALGPAYACSCILLRFNPRDSTACADGATHPSHAKRAHFILKVLEQMNKTTEGAPYTKVIGNLRGMWQNTLKSAADAQVVDLKEIPPLEYQVFELYRIVARYLGTLKYTRWDRAIELSKLFVSDVDPQSLLNVDDSVSDVLNGAWLWRLQQPDENGNAVRQVNLKAIALCREIIARNDAHAI